MRSLIASSVAVAALIAVPQLASAQAPNGNAPFCLKSTSGVANCIYQSLAQCEQVKLAADQCLTSAQAGGTVGQGSPSQTPGAGQQPPLNRPAPSPAPAPAPQPR